ncbi:hypothetical protein GQ53DRAFT_758428 [Thozetella sp. PMI_491]|nr:hypothetical protein GQ53DRAFT_758428 [Thozetella sp. PMI_491]
MAGAVAQAVMLHVGGGERVVFLRYFVFNSPCLVALPAPLPPPQNAESPLMIADDEKRLGYHAPLSSRGHVPIRPERVDGHFGARNLRERRGWCLSRAQSTGEQPPPQPGWWDETS